MSARLSQRAWQGEPGRISESLAQAQRSESLERLAPCQAFQLRKKHCSASSFYVSENLHTKKGTHLYLFRKAPELHV